MCGIIMPLSAMDGYTAEHWGHVQTILNESIMAAGFRPDMVSNSDEVSIIQKNIVQNIYNNEIIVCDISGRNPNVMFELGMRLTFDKPTVIVKDDDTAAPFDTSVIEYIQYRRDLRYNDIQSFKKRLTDKIIATHKMKDEPGYSPFIKHFGDFIVPKIEQKEVDPMNFIIQNLELMRKEMQLLSANQGLDGRLWRTGPMPQSENWTKNFERNMLHTQLQNFLSQYHNRIEERQYDPALVNEIEHHFYEVHPVAKRFTELVRSEIRGFFQDVKLAEARRDFASIPENPNSTTS